MEALYALAGVMPPGLVFPATGWVLSPDGHWITKLLAMSLAAQAAIAWTLRDSPHRGVAKALAFYQFASATTDWVMWLLMSSEGIFSNPLARAGVLVAIPTHYLCGVLARAGRPPTGGAPVKLLVRFCALYNASALVTFLTPGALELLGVKLPGAAFWLWLPSLFALFAAVVLWLSSADLERYGAFPFWNGIVRVTFVVVSVLLDFGGSVGSFVTLLAAGDLVLGLGCVVGLPLALQRSPLDLLLNRQRSDREAQS
jgi:hypothetical protein